MNSDQAQRQLNNQITKNSDIKKLTLSKIKTSNQDQSSPFKPAKQSREKSGQSYSPAVALNKQSFQNLAKIVPKSHRFEYSNVTNGRQLWPIMIHNPSCTDQDSVSRHQRSDINLNQFHEKQQNTPIAPNAQYPQQAAIHSKSLSQFVLSGRGGGVIVTSGGTMTNKAVRTPTSAGTSPGHLPCRSEAQLNTNGQSSRRVQPNYSKERAQKQSRQSISNNRMSRNRSQSTNSRIPNETLVYMQNMEQRLNLQISQINKRLDNFEKDFIMQFKIPASQKNKDINQVPSLSEQEVAFYANLQECQNDLPCAGPVSIRLSVPMTHRFKESNNKSNHSSSNLNINPSKEAIKGHNKMKKQNNKRQNNNKKLQKHASQRMYGHLYAKIEQQKQKLEELQNIKQANEQIKARQPEKQLADDLRQDDKVEAKEKEESQETNPQNFEGIDQERVQRNKGSGRKRMNGGCREDNEEVRAAPTACFTGLEAGINQEYIQFDDKNASNQAKRDQDRERMLFSQSMGPPGIKALQNCDHFENRQEHEREENRDSQQRQTDNKQESSQKQQMDSIQLQQWSRMMGSQQNEQTLNFSNDLRNINMYRQYDLMSSQEDREAQDLKMLEQMQFYNQINSNQAQIQLDSCSNAPLNGFYRGPRSDRHQSKTQPEQDLKRLLERQQLSPISNENTGFSQMVQFYDQNGQTLPLTSAQAAFLEILKAEDKPGKKKKQKLTIDFSNQDRYSPSISLRKSILEDWKSMPRSIQDDRESINIENKRNMTIDLALQDLHNQKNEILSRYEEINNETYALEQEKRRQQLGYNSANPVASNHDMSFNQNQYSQQYYGPKKARSKKKIISIKNFVEDLNQRQTQKLEKNLNKRVEDVSNSKSKRKSRGRGSASRPGGNSALSCALSIPESIGSQHSVKNQLNINKQFERISVGQILQNSKGYDSQLPLDSIDQLKKENKGQPAGSNKAFLAKNQKSKAAIIDRAQGLTSQPNKFMDNMAQKYGQQKITDDHEMKALDDEKLFDQSDVEEQKLQNQQHLSRLGVNNFPSLKTNDDNNMNNFLISQGFQNQYQAYITKQQLSGAARTTTDDIIQPIDFQQYNQLNGLSYNAQAFENQQAQNILLNQQLMKNLKQENLLNANSVQNNLPNMHPAAEGNRQEVWEAILIGNSPPQLQNECPNTYLSTPFSPNALAQQQNDILKELKYSRRNQDGLISQSNLMQNHASSDVQTINLNNIRSSEQFNSPDVTSQNRDIQFEKVRGQELGEQVGPNVNKQAIQDFDNLNELNSVIGQSAQKRTDASKVRKAQLGSTTGNQKQAILASRPDNVGGARDGHLQDLLPTIQNRAYIDAPPSESGGSEAM